MDSQAADPRVAAALDQIRAGLDALAEVGPVLADLADARVVIREAEELARRQRAFQIDLLAEVERRGLHRLDGHASAKVLVRHVAQLSAAEASRRAKAARALQDLPEVAAAYRAGAVGSCQVDRIARAHANPRVRPALVEQDAALAVGSAGRAYSVFDGWVTDWVRRVDQDGTCDAAERHHEDRDASFLQDYDGSWSLGGSFGSLQGAEFDSIFRRFVDLEFLADWAAVRAEHGNAACADLLPRTDKQRRADALVAMARAAADAHAASPGGSVIVTDIVIDHATFVAEVAALVTARPELADQLQSHLHQLDQAALVDEVDEVGQVDQLDQVDQVDQVDEVGQVDQVDQVDQVGHVDSEAGPPTPPPGQPPPEGPPPGGHDRDGFRCSTLDGHPIDVREAVTHALIGHVRRVVIGAGSRVIDLGRRRRLFTGAAELAVRLGSRCCYWPGCEVPISRTQIDHVQPWVDPAHPDDPWQGGRTDVANGGGLCGRHNRHKQHGYRVCRDPDGTWHTFRPDGTEIR